MTIGERDSAPNLRITISVLTYRRRDSLAELLAHLEGLGDAVDEVLVVDNCSDDGTAELVCSCWPRVRLLRTERNVGVVARNLGLRTASGEVVVTLDDDIVGLTRDDLDHLRARFREDPRLGALNFKVLDYFSDTVSNWVHHRPLSDAEGSFATYEITEGAVAFRKEAVCAVGCYHEAYFISHEGPDLAFHLMNAGFRVAYDGAVAVRHKHERGARHPDRFYYYDTRNQFWLAARNMPPGPALRYLAIGQLAMAWYAVRDGRPRPWLRGVRDGLCGLRAALATRQPWTSTTAMACREIDRHRPGFWVTVRKRMFGAANRLED
jgi:GT2 family glycosyltransferase